MKADSIVVFNSIEYALIRKTKYMNRNYLFVMNPNNSEDIRFLVAKNSLKEINGLSLIKNIVSKR